MATIRERANGTYELRVTHPKLQRPYYSTHDDHGQAEAYAKRLKDALDRGEVPPELQQQPRTRAVPVSQMLRAYLNGAPIAPSDRPMVEWLQENLRVTVDGITVRWVDQWVIDMKRIENLAPGTIRKRVESLARALDWWNKREHEADKVPANPLRMLPRGYSAYKQEDVPEAPPEGFERRVDVRRDRRLHDDEPARIEAALMGEKRPGRQRPLDVSQSPQRDDFLLLWRLIVNTGMRLREAYRLRVSDIRFDLRTIHVSRTKMARGHSARSRDIPMTRQVFDWLKAHPGLGGAAGGALSNPAALVFPFWSGEDDDLAATTNRLSQAFRRVFAYADCEDLTEHDLRHEATCRWMMMKGPDGQWLFRPEEVRRITGHVSVQQFERYLSLRGSDLAARLW
jgi:integrase